MNNISQAVKRFDFDDKIAGRAQYCPDIKHPGMLYARTLRSTKAHAQIISIAIPALPPGYFIVDHRDIPGRNIVPIVVEDQPFLAGDTVNYIGEPILLVVGEDKPTILQIIEQIAVNYRELPPILSIAEAMELETGFIYGNQAHFVEYEYTKGDLDAAIKNARFYVEDEFRTGYQEQAYLETQSMLAVYANNRITVTGSMQCPYYIKEALIQALGWPEERIRVVQLPTGGGFGGKEEYPSIIGVHAALAAIKTKRPVQLVLDRQEDITCSTKRHPAIIKIKSYIDTQDRIIGREIDVKSDAGAYAGLSSVVLQRMIYSASGAYNIPNLSVRGRAYATNKVVSGAFRGFGGPQAFFAIEMHMENIAQRLNMDSLELKRRHFLKTGDTSSTEGVFHYDIKLDKIADEVIRLSDYNHKRQGSLPGSKNRYGIGCSIFFHGCGFTGVGEIDIIKTRVRLKKYRDNRVQIFVSSTEIGQGSLTTLSKIVANLLEIPLTMVIHEYPDTDTCPDSGPTVASRTTMIVGKLVNDCALEIKNRWEEPEVEVERKFIYPADRNWDKTKNKGNAYLEYSWGANVVEVEIDPLTYAINIIGIWAVYDIGTPIDEKIVKGQIEGGLVQGLGYGCMEVLDIKEGRILQNNLTNYNIPTSLDIPTLEYRLIDNPYPDGPCGARGLGELPLVGVAPALALAVQNAIGKKITHIPLTPEYIMELMSDA